MTSAHRDTFARDNLPPPELQPEYLFDLPELRFPEQLNCATELLDRRVAAGHGDALCLQAPGGVRWTYADLLDRANRIAHVLVHDMGVVPGNRVLLRAPNNPMLAACWFAVMKAGAIAVATMPLLRAKELTTIIDKARVTLALCDARLAGELREAASRTATLAHVRHFNDASADGLEARDGEAVAEIRQRRHRRRRHVHHRLHVRHHRRSQGHDAFPPRHDGDLRLLSAARAACDLRRRLHRHARRSRSRSGSAACSCFPCASARRRCCSRDPRPTRCVDGDQGVRRHRAASRRRRRIAPWRHAVPSSALRSCASACPAGEVLPAATRDAVEGGDRHRAHRRDRRHRDPAHLHLAPTKRTRGRVRRASRYPATRARRRRRRSSRPAGYGRAARGQGPDGLPLPRRRAPDELREGRLEPTPATRTSSTTTATSGTRRAPTT